MSASQNDDGILLHKTDLVIVGTEGAGSTAALEASRRGLSVIMITKGNGLGRSGATVTGQADLAVDSRSLHNLLHFKGCDPDDSMDKFFEDIVRGGKFLNQQDLVQIHVQDASERLKDLLDWGLKPVQVIKGGGHRYPRGVMVNPPEMIRIYRKRIRSTEVKILSNVMVQELLTGNGQCVGVLGLNLKTGQLIIVRSKATLLATGGGMRIYPVTTAPEELTGDGTAMAYRAGVQLMDMEFPMFMPGVFPWPQAVMGINTPFKLSSAGWRVHGHLLNKYGERFMANWDPVRMERSTRDIVAVAIGSEIQEGRGSSHGGVFVSVKHLPDNLIEYLFQWLPPKLLKYYGGFDMRKFLPDLTRFAVEAVPGSHFFNGGIKIDASCHTSLPGLYAAGEVTAGIHGSNRLSGNAFTDMVVWGHRAAVSIANETRNTTSPPDMDAEQVDNFRFQVLECVNRSKGENAEVLRAQLTKAAWEDVSVVRSRESLERARLQVRELQKAGMEISLSYKGKVYNREWIRALEFQNMAVNLLCIVEAALAREESRGAHYRKDFPQTDHERWLKNQIICLENGDLRIKKETPRITTLPPPQGLQKYGF